MSKDWTGNGNSVFKTLAESNHSSTERQPEDYYATEPRAAELLLENESFDGPIWECACGEKHLSNVFTNWGGDVRSSDLYDRCGNEVFDFLSIENTHWDGNIITNPPYKFALDFVYKALQIVPDGKKVCMFLKIQFLEGKARRELFRSHPPKVVYVSSSRLLCAPNGDFEHATKNGGSAVAYAWFVWEKGYTGLPQVDWIG